MADLCGGVRHHDQTGLNEGLDDLPGGVVDPGEVRACRRRCGVAAFGGGAGQPEEQRSGDPLLVRVEPPVHGLRALRDRRLQTTGLLVVLQRQGGGRAARDAARAAAMPR